MVLRVLDEAQRYLKCWLSPHVSASPWRRLLFTQPLLLLSEDEEEEEEEEEEEKEELWCASRLHWSRPLYDSLHTCVFLIVIRIISCENISIEEKTKTKVRKDAKISNNRLIIKRTADEKQKKQTKQTFFKKQKEKW